jgi:hypothetical protein
MSDYSYSVVAILLCKQLIKTRLLLYTYYIQLIQNKKGCSDIPSLFVVLILKQDYLKLECHRPRIFSDGDG